MPGCPRVIGVDGAAIPGLFVAGEMLGGLFSQNNPGGTVYLRVSCSAG